MKVLFLKPRLSYKAGSVVDVTSWKSGLVRTLLNCKAVAKVEEDDNSLDTDAGDKPVKPSSKPKRSKGSPKTK